jgi:hypothetical protein
MFGTSASRIRFASIRGRPEKSAQGGRKTELLHSSVAQGDHAAEANQEKQE